MIEKYERDEINNTHLSADGECTLCSRLLLSIIFIYNFLHVIVRDAG